MIMNVCTASTIADECYLYNMLLEPRVTCYYIYAKNINKILPLTSNSYQMRCFVQFSADLNVKYGNLHAHNYTTLI